VITPVDEDDVRVRSCARDAIARLADCRFLGQAF
jgi:hypothetical protein